MANTLQIKKTESIFDEMNRLHAQIMKRAYELFDGNGHVIGKDVDNWLQAERELVWKPAIELEEKDDEFRLRMATPGVDPKDLTIEVTPEDILVKGEIRREQKEPTSHVYVSEFTAANLFRSVHLPKKIDPDKARAEFKNGMLALSAPIAKEARAPEAAATAS